MDINLVKKLVKVLEESKLSELEVEQEGLKVKLSKGTAFKGETFAPHHFVPQPQFHGIELKESNEVKDKAEPAAQAKDLHEVKSPIVGSFYRAPSPDAEPYVRVGDRVSTGTVLCIVEAMKLMNEIISEVDGEIVKILVENGQPVEYNQPLFLVKI
ncbi:MAG: acetyl-CoA carboxylase biotin carboxyl carrier protein [Ignavibacteriales bacterium]|jgi:acetyl-CoA carboxylase biotin carboxyl carrier protein|nr:acetyl-CoA carboxylase biotin carboxyl carrier protein [Ignavibacteriaceae bacterium]NLH60283.1 acetyl-CoA carboxylase biotin carboxyl carrier protein [Ignavibacteriales bacterium]HOJ19175.1 acetyl-CoA carboxylase biotin carboxyl carrier protein [Ignavibacteriaceae bacterium]HPO54694.1 acetyl-CoA carboxylase biotin carboxyl carrier protein [Ignavibacteriaceae bacterium]